jgi:hypothetical protein
MNTTIKMSDAQVGDRLVWHKDVHVDPFTSVPARFSGTVVEPPEPTGDGHLQLMVELSGGWQSVYIVPSTTLAQVLEVTS